MAKKVFAKNRHSFKFKITHPVTGKVETKIYWARVRHATKSVDLVLTADHVKRSIRLRGVGDTTKCSMAVCSLNHEDAFPHPVIGLLDWTYDRIFVGSKLNKDGWPIECVAYDHGDEIAKLNDSAGGQRKLLKQLEENGPRIIHLKPIRVRSKKGRSGEGRPVTGARTSNRKGAKARFAYAQVHGGI